MIPRKFRKKPVVVEAMQWDGTPECASAIVDWANHERPLASYISAGKYHAILIHTHDGLMTIDRNDWIIRVDDGRLFHCYASTFAAKYEEAE